MSLEDAAVKVTTKLFAPFAAMLLLHVIVESYRALPSQVPPKMPIESSRPNVEKQDEVITLGTPWQSTVCSADELGFPRADP